MKNYREIITEDGSTTLFSKLYDEACHSTAGAIQETQLHYIQGCQVENKLQNQTAMNILEVGFGTGIGFLETYKVLSKYQKAVNFISLEIDKELIEIFAKNYGYEFLENSNTYTLKLNHINLIIYLGDARETIKQVKEKFHAIYQDAFSPKRNADLWTTEWFSALKERSSQDCIMSTYSASSSIRKSMISAGWKLYSGDKFGPKRTSTRARLTGETEAAISDKLKRSPAQELTDSNRNEYKLG